MAKKTKAKVDDKAFNFMTAVADKTKVDIKKEGLYSDYTHKARGLRKGMVRPNYDESGKRIGESTVRMRTEIDPTGKTNEWKSFPTLFYDKKKFADEGGWHEYGEDDIEGAYREALGRGEVFEFGQDKESALKFGEGSWKLPEFLKKMRK